MKVQPSAGEVLLRALPVGTAVVVFQTAGNPWPMHGVVVSHFTEPVPKGWSLEPRVSVSVKLDKPMRGYKGDIVVVGVTRNDYDHLVYPLHVWKQVCALQPGQRLAYHDGDYTHFPDDMVVIRAIDTGSLLGISRTTKFLSSTTVTAYRTSASVAMSLLLGAHLVEWGLLPGDFICAGCAIWESTARATAHGKNQGYCYYCSYWLDRYNEYKKGLHVVADGQCYSIGDELRSDNSMRGFGGQKFHFRMLDGGSDIISTNVWSQGAVPEEWRALIKDNAVHVRESPPAG